MTIDKNHSIDIISLYDKYSDALFGIILRIVKDQHIAEEVLQDTFVKIWQNLDQYQSSKASIFTWMSKIARNLSLNAVQSKAVKKAGFTFSIDQLKEDNISDIKINENFDLRTHINILNNDQKQIIELVYFNGFTHQETHQYLGIPLGTVKSRIKLALNSLSHLFIVSDAAKFFIFFLLIKVQ